MAQGQRGVRLLGQLSAVCVLVVIILWHRGREVLMKADLTYSLAVRSNAALVWRGNTKVNATSAPQHHDDDAKWPIGSAEQQKLRLNVFDEKAFTLANTGKDWVNPSACQLTRHLTVNRMYSYRVVT